MRNQAMLVHTFSLMPIGAAGTHLDQETQGYQLWLNGIQVSPFLFYYYSVDEMMQIEGCEECSMHGCSDYGYVRVLRSNGYFIW